MCDGLIAAVMLSFAAPAPPAYPAPPERMEDVRALCETFPSIVQLGGAQLEEVPVERALLGCMADNDDESINAFRALTDALVRYLYIERLKTPEDPFGAPMLLTIEAGDIQRPDAG
ncbi:MAG: hypothetical protein RIA71_13620 [Oceanicaulis sp.]